MKLVLIILILSSVSESYAFSTLSKAFRGLFYSPISTRRYQTPQQQHPGGYVGECYISNPSCGTTSTVKVDVAGRCMCIGYECFVVSIGRGAHQTANGTSRIGLTSGMFNRKSSGRAPGVIYETKAPGTTTAYDNDAVAMGIPRNDGPGKWFHKPANCVHPTRYVTDGCIAVPCDRWPLLKAQIGQSLTVCGGAGPQTRSNNYPRPSLRAMIDQVTENAAYVDDVQRVREVQ